VGDFNADSDPDLAVASLFSNDVSVLLGQAGGGDFGAATSFPTNMSLRRPLRWATSAATATRTWRRQRLLGRDRGDGGWCRRQLEVRACESGELH
jgi:hypothetical protein